MSVVEFGRMRWKRTIQLLDVHCEGEIGKVAIGGVPKIPGNSIAEQLNHINTVDDSLRRFLCLEPRARSVVLRSVGCRRSPATPWQSNWPG
jgi:proline racemase